MTARNLRLAPTQPEFNTRDFPVAGVTRIASVAWIRLHKKAYPNRFYASPGSRLTPVSLDIPCCYLGATPETAVAEVWGDQFYARKEQGGKVFSINVSRADCYEFLALTSPLPQLRLCDLTDPQTRAGVGIDSGTLYSLDLHVPQAWAQVLAMHPANLDGVVYRSRHTDLECVVLWTRSKGRRLDKELKFERSGPFRESSAARRLAQHMGLRLAFLR